jgi:uncharacterized protein YdeI (YjbR/CyaY-like superfamily)
MTTDSRVDAYIANAGSFAQPILLRIRQIVHAALPDVEEGIKWGMPHFMVGAKNVAGMSAFKAHCALIILGAGRQGSDGMGSYGKITSLEELPSDAEIGAKLKAAAESVRFHGSAGPRKGAPSIKPPIAMPDDFAALLAADPLAHAAFENLAASYRREYLAWITGAKREDTRVKRLTQAIEWLAEGKKLNWKYEKC